MPLLRVTQNSSELMRGHSSSGPHRQMMPSTLVLMYSQHTCIQFNKKFKYLSQAFINRVFSLPQLYKGKKPRGLITMLISFLIFAQILVFVDLFLEQGGISSFLSANGINPKMLRGIWHSTICSLERKEPNVFTKFRTLWKNLGVLYLH